MGHFGGSFLFLISGVNHFPIHTVEPRHESAPSSYFAPSVPIWHHLTWQHVKSTLRVSIGDRCPPWSTRSVRLSALSDPPFFIQIAPTARCFLSGQLLSSGSGWAEFRKPNCLIFQNFKLFLLKCLLSGPYCGVLHALNKPT